MTWTWGDLSPNSYATIIADPAWRFNNYSIKGIRKGAEWHYECMSLDQIKALPVAQLAKRDALLLLWTTGWAIAEGYAQDVARAWGFKPVSEMVWRKVTINGKARWGPGYRVRSIHEPILVCTVGKPVFKALPSCFDGIAGVHSAKPIEFYDIVRKATRDLLWRCDLFSAGIARNGFESHGTSHRTDSAKALRQALQARQSAGAG